jgi:histidinol-phosphate phosphatase family protein
MSAPAAGIGGARQAVFFDRDGTLIEDVHYIADPAQVVLRPGAAESVRRLNAAGWLALVVTNQSGIARGKLTEADYRRVEARVAELLAAGGARLDASYFCPHLPEVTGPCACRKPGTALYEQAAAEHGIDLARSAYVGDRLRDVEPARRLGGLGVLVPSRDTPWLEQQRSRDDYTLNTTLSAAIDRVLAARWERQ